MLIVIHLECHISFYEICLFLNLTIFRFIPIVSKHCTESIVNTFSEFECDDDINKVIFP